MSDGALGPSLESFIAILEYTDLASSELGAGAEVLASDSAGRSEAALAFVTRKAVVDLSIERLSSVLQGQSRLAWESHLQSEEYLAIRAQGEQLSAATETAPTTAEERLTETRSLLEFAAKYVTGIRNLVIVSGNESADALADLRADRLRQITLTASVLAALIILTLMMLQRAVQAMTEPLAALRERARLVSAGELGSEPLLVGGPAELGEVVVAFNAMSENLRGLRDRLALAADGELASVAPLPGDLGKELNRSMHRLTKTMTELRETRDQLSYEATHDSLTGLTNRAGAMQWLSAATTNDPKEPVALVFVDLDGFKAVNDVHNHLVGDEVLRTTALRLRNLVRPDWLIARFGGDEFMLAGKGPTVNDVTMSSIGNAIVAALREPVAVRGVSSQVGASVGIAMFGASRFPEITELLATADAACYEAKAAGGGMVVLRNVEVEVAVSERGASGANSTAAAAAAPTDLFV